MIIALDAMGGDYAPEETVAGAVTWSQASDDVVLLVGREESLQGELVKYDYDRERIRIINASQVMGMDEPVASLRKKQDSSIVVATRLVKEGQAEAVVSCGSTGGADGCGNTCVGETGGN